MTHVEPHKEFVMATAITTLIAMVALYLPVFGVVVSLFLPLPVLFYRMKLGRPWGALILIAVTLLIASMMGWQSISSAAFFFELCLVGLVLSEVFSMNLSVEKTVAVTTGIVMATGLVILTLFGLLSTNSLSKGISDYLYENLALVVDMYRDMEGAEEVTTILAQSMEGIVYVTLRILPAVAFVLILFVVWSNLLVARPLLRSKALFCPDFGSLNQWKAPEPLVWVVILSGLLLFLPHQGLKLLGANGLIIMMMIYFLQGIAIVSFYFQKKQFPRMFRGVLYALVALWQPALLLVILAGLFDMWIDFRRIKNRGVNRQDESHT